MSFIRRRWPLILIAFLLLDALALGAFVPVQYSSREEVFEIPTGTWQRRMAGEKIEILPSAVYLTLGVRNVLLLRNLDTVPQMFGPTLIMPGQSFKLPFDQTSEYQFACSAHLNGQMTVVVDEEPVAGWMRLQWRVKNLGRWLRAHLWFPSSSLGAQTAK